MSTMVYWSFPLVLAFVMIMPRLAQRLPPATATWVLSVGSVFCAAATAWSLLLLGLHFLGRIPAVAEFFGWSRRVLAAHDQVSAVVAAFGAGLAVAAVGLGGREAAHQLGRLRLAHRFAALLGRSDLAGALAGQEASPARAVPGRPGRILVCADLMIALTPPEREVVLARARAHLTHHHHLHVAAVRVAAAANPLLRRLVPVTALCIEMWADRDAADTCDPATVANTLLHMADSLQARSGGRSTATTTTPPRVRRLLAGPARAGLLTWCPAPLLFGLGLSAVLATRDTELLFEAAFGG